MSFTDNLTLDEIAAVDAEMHKVAIKNANRYHFQTDEEASTFVAYSIKAALDHLGVKPPYDEKKDIKVERRTLYRGADEWRNGFYIYQRGEMVAFIGAPQCHQLALNRFTVVSNVDPERRIAA